jgi:hypothetical protein
MVAIFSRLRHRISFTALFLAFLSVAAMLATPAWLGRSSQATGSSVGPQKAYSSSEMTSAIASLQSGDGPSGVGPMSCSSEGLGSAYCETTQSEQAASTSTVDPPWTNITSTGGPSPRVGASMAYDAADGYVVLFSGGSSAFSSDTWNFLHGSWMKIMPNSSPSARFDASMVYDNADGYVVLFGGSNSSFVFGDTWKFHGGIWTNITSGSGPSPRLDASIAYDAADGYAILFGGLTRDAGSLSDTWRFHGGIWTNITSSSGPSPRFDASMVYDAADGYVILFGGGGSSGISSDTWKFLHGSWTNIMPSSSPSSRYSGSIAYDVADGYVILFGGLNRSDVVIGDTWKFLGGSWTNITSGSGPSPRFRASLAYDATDGYVVLFGGLSSSLGGLSNYIGDTWKFSSGVAPPAFDFSLSTPSPDSLTVVQGSTSSSSITATLVSGATSPVAFTPSGIGINSGLSVTTYNSPCNPTCSVTISFSATATATLGTTTITIGAIGGGASHSTTISVTVVAPIISTSTSVSCSPSSITVGSQSTCTATVTNSQNSLIGTPIPATLYNQLAGVSNTTLAAVGSAQGVINMTSITGSPLTIGGKPEFLYIGAQFCPFCAAEKWPMIVALSRFGTFNGLEYMLSADSPEVYPDTPTFTFVDSTYTSQYVAFVSVEAYDRNHNPLQSLTSAEQALLSQYDSVGGLAFIDIANQWAMNTQYHAGSQFSPSDLDGIGNWTQIASQLNDPNSAIAKAVDGAANYLITAICKADGGNPAIVCSQSFAGLTRTPSTVNDIRASNSLNLITVDNIQPQVVSNPTGTVTFAQSGSGSVNFSTSSCTLSSGSCSVTVTGAVAGSSNIQAVYSGDTSNAGSEGVASLTITGASVSTHVSLSCSPSSMNVATFASCTVTVTGTSPSGSVTFSTSSRSGFFTPSTRICTLNSAGTCSIVYTDIASSNTTAVISGSYPGDTQNTAATGTFSLTIVKPSIILATATSSVTIDSGTAAADQTSTTGISVTITGSTATNGTPAAIDTQDLGSLSPGVGTVSLSGAKYYDVVVSGISSGSAKVCVSDSSATSATTMQYWTGTAWTSASTVTVNGGTVCGSIPVSALTGTNVAIGNTIQSAPAQPTILGLNPPLFYEIIGTIVAVIVIASAALVLRQRGRTKPTI